MVRDPGRSALPLEGRAAIVSGASRSIGYATAIALARDGAHVLLHATSVQHLHRCQAALLPFGRQVAVCDGDLARPETATRLVDTALMHFGHVDIVVNSAGITRDGMLHRLSTADWLRVIDVNLNGAFYLTRAAAIPMRRQAYGRIIHLSSSAYQGNLGQANYAASKAGMVALTKTAALELGRYGVTCNAICPGVIDTDMTHALPLDIMEKFIARIPAGRLGLPQELGNFISLLAREETAYLNGAVIGFDGGFRL